MITGQELQSTWEVIGKIGVMIGVIVAIAKGFEYLMSKMPVSKLEQRVEKVEKKVNNDYERFQDVESRINSIEQKISNTDETIQSINQSIKMIGESQISLMHHFINGNGHQEMAKEVDKLTKYFIEN